MSSGLSPPSAHSPLLVQLKLPVSGVQGPVPPPPSCLETTVSLFLECVIWKSSWNLSFLINVTTLYWTPLLSMGK